MADDEDVAEVVDRERHAVHPAVAPEQELVELLTVLVGPADEERLDQQRVVAEDEPGGGLQLVRAFEYDEIGAFVDAIERELALGQRLADDLVELSLRHGAPARAAVGTPGPASSASR